MPGSIDEMVAFARMLLDAERMPDTIPTWSDGTQPTPEEAETLIALVLYEGRCRDRRRRAIAARPARRKAYQLLRQFLTPEQAACLARLGHFYLTTPAGRSYRLRPRDGRIEEVERHGTQMFARRSFCLHPDEEHAVPSPDVTLAHMLLLLSDEAEFHGEANVTERHTQLWNGDWLRQLYQARRERI